MEKLWLKFGDIIKFLFHGYKKLFCNFVFWASHVLYNSKSINISCWGMVTVILIKDAIAAAVILLGSHPIFDIGNDWHSDFILPSKQSMFQISKKLTCFISVKIMSHINNLLKMINLKI